MLVDLVTAKLHLRVTDSAEDSLVTLWEGAAEQQVSEFLNRNLYADDAELAAAIVDAPTALATATAAYAAAMEAAALLDETVDRKAAEKYAMETYLEAREQSDRTQRGMVVNETIQAAILLALGNLYEHRGEDAEGLPKAAKSLLQPYRAGMGV